MHATVNTVMKNVCYSVLLAGVCRRRLLSSVTLAVGRPPGVWEQGMGPGAWERGMGTLPEQEGTWTVGAPATWVEWTVGTAGQYGYVQLGRHLVDGLPCLEWSACLMEFLYPTIAHVL